MTTKKELYEWYKSKNICTKCGTNKVKPGCTMCWDCAEKSNIQSQNYYHNKMTEDQYKRKIAYNKRKRELCVAFGLCRDCLKRDAVKGKFCLECYIKYTRRNKKKSEAAISRTLRVEYGLCYFCGKEVKPGKKTCPDCYNNRKITMLKNKFDNINHVWHSAI